VFLFGEDLLVSFLFNFGRQKLTNKNQKRATYAPSVIILFL